MVLHHSQNNPMVSREPVHETQSFLPYDLTVDILLRLPVRSLLRFKCICKSYETLISDPKFAKSHLRCSTADPTMTHQRLVYPDFLTINFCPFKPLFEENLFEENSPTSVKGKTITSYRMDQPYRVLGSCNGLLCLCEYYHFRKFRLWNPCTRLKSKWSPTVIPNVVEITHFGFGYDQVNDKYKMLVAGTVRDGHNYIEQTKIYTFGANSWTIIQNPPCNPSWSFHGTFVSGTLNWVAKTKIGGDQWVILSFDLEKETYREMLLPQQHGCDGGDDGNNDYISTLNTLRNCLCVSLVDSNKTQWVVWLMEEYGVLESWTKLITIPLSLDKFSSSEPMSSFHPLCISENGIVLGTCFSDYKFLFLYDSKNGGRMIKYHASVKQSRGLQPINNGRYRRLQQTYHESLVSPLC